MKVVHIVPGSGGTFYCENCLRDNALVKALRALGHDVLMVPMYLPMFADDPGISGDVPVFFGGINVYLQQKLALFRRTPRWLDRLVDANWILKLAARKSGSTRASGLAEMTLSMIRGEQGNQAKELDRLVRWLADYERPDIVHLSNALLIGLAHLIRSELGVPVICSLQDEDTWIDEMSEEEGTRCWKAIAACAEDVALFIAVSSYYGRKMQERLDLSADRLRIVHVGTETTGHTPTAVAADRPVIGFLSRLSETQGLGLLVEAFILLKESGRYTSLRLHATGGLTGDNRRFIAGLKRTLQRKGFTDDVAFLPDFDRAARLSFLSELTVLSVPVPEGEAFGTFIIEAMASGVPVVQPSVGAFPELIEKGGGGILYQPNDASALAAALGSLLDDPAKARELGRQGRVSFERHFTIERMAREMVDVYRAVGS